MQILSKTEKEMSTLKDLQKWFPLISPRFVALCEALTRLSSLLFHKFVHGIHSYETKKLLYSDFVLCHSFFRIFYKKLRGPN